MRLAGVGMVGVVHASEAVDAVQRFIGKIELGMIPHVVDTVIFINAGQIEKVYELSLTVKVPSGMVEKDLTRPVVEIRDFETKQLIYEIYTYGEENVVIPIEEGGEKETGLESLAKERIKQVIEKYDSHAEIDFLSKDRIQVKVDNDVIPRLIGRNGSNISKVEEKLGISIDVEPRVATTGKKVKYDVEEVGNNVIFDFKEPLKGEMVNVYVGDEYLLSATVGKSNEVKITKDSPVGKKLVKALLSNKKIRILAV
jgi:ATPase